MERYASGDDSAFRPLVDALSPCLHSYILRKVRDVDGAKELVHVTFTKIVNGRRTFKKGSSATAWAFSVLRNLYADHGKKKREQLLDDGDADAPSDDASPEEAAASRELCALVREQLANLPPLQREGPVAYVAARPVRHYRATRVTNLRVARIGEAEALRCLRRRKLACSKESSGGGVYERDLARSLRPPRDG